MGDISAVADIRGAFTQNTTAVVFLRITDFDGNPRDADVITTEIHDSSDNLVTIQPAQGEPFTVGAPVKCDEGYYAFDWPIPFDQAVGQYTVVWNYTVDTVPATVRQIITVSSTGSGSRLYCGRIIEFRESLTNRIKWVQALPVYNEQAKESRDRRTYRFTFDKWNQTPGVRIYRNGLLQRDGFTVNYFKGEVTFDQPLTEFDQVNADYNFRWFTDQELDRFLSDALHVANMYPPATRSSLYNAPDNLIPMILYGATVDAIRRIMLDLIVQEPELVFGGPDAAAKKFGELESLKQNYEKKLDDLLEKKKFGPYKGLTKMITTPPFSLPGGRSRWFRYLFSNSY